MGGHIIGGRGVAGEERRVAYHGASAAVFTVALIVAVCLVGASEAARRGFRFTPRIGMS